MKKYVDSARFTIYYFGSANSTKYPHRVSTAKTIRKWYDANDKKLNDIAGIVEGSYCEDVEAFEFQEKVLNNSVSLRDIVR